MTLRLVVHQISTTNPYLLKQRINGSANSNVCFTPFGGGQRLCPGLELSKLEISIFLHQLVTRYRCEEFVKKETEMEQTVRNLETELEDAKSKCAQLALLVDAEKKEMQQV